MYLKVGFLNESWLASGVGNIYNVTCLFMPILMIVYYFIALVI